MEVTITFTAEEIEALTVILDSSSVAIDVSKTVAAHPTLEEKVLRAWLESRL